MRTGIWLVSMLLVLGGILSEPGEAMAAEGPPADLAKLRDQAKELQHQILKAEADLAALKEQEKYLSLPGSADALRVSQDQLAKAIGDLLGKEQDSQKEALDRLVKAADQEYQAARKHWHGTWTEKFRFDDTVVQLEAEHGFVWNATGGASAGDASVIGVLLGGLLFLLLSLLLAAYELRLPLRRWLRGRQTAKVLLLMMLLPLAGCQDSAPGGPSQGGVLRWRQEKEDLQQGSNDLQKKLDDLERKVKQKQGEVTKLRDDQLRSRFGGLGREGEQRRRAEEEALEKVHVLLAKVRLTERLLEQSTTTLARVEKDQEELGRQVSAQRSRTLVHSAARMALGIGLLLAALGLVGWVWKRLHQQRAGERKQCPRCLASGSLEEKQTAVQDARYPEPRYLHCPECDYEFRASYLRLPRLCFPTVGIYGSGKTHWLVTAYDLISNNNVPVRASFVRAPSLGDERFEKIMQLVLESHQNPAATQHELPSPLNFHVLDTDRLGTQAAMLNLFDFSGEMMEQRIDTDVFRRRALLMDGFVLFLDPTQVRGGSAYSIEAQVRALARFHEEMRDIRSLDVGDKINVPIAVCISKLDLLTTQNPLGSAALPWIKSLRGTVSGAPNLRTLRYRSQLCEQVLPIMFPGWNIKRTLQESFGNRFLFFPLTPVGLEESELGREDLQHRTFVPFGVMEPILWLLHMHGYDMLKRNGVA